MGEPRVIAGCLVLKTAPARIHRRYKVVICHLTDVKKGAPHYVVWYIDDKDKPTDGRFYRKREAAQSEFDRRT